MPSNSINSGYYGKIPAVGDFISYNLIRDFVKPWDDWLQTVITETKDALGDEWLNTYLTSPIYRFVLTPGNCGEEGYFGVMIPSVDRVGRYFPFMICTPLPQQANPFEQLAQLEEWFDFAEQIALRTLEADFDTDELTAAMQQLDIIYQSTFTTAADEFQTKSNSSGYIAIRQSMHETQNNASIYSSLLNSLLQEVSYAYSIWWTKGSQVVQPSMLVTQGLPPAKQVSAFYDGLWAKHGWFDNDPGSLLVNLSGEETVEMDPWDRIEG